MSSISDRVKEELKPRDDDKRFDVRTIGWIAFTVFATWFFREHMPFVGPVHYRWVFAIVVVLFVFRKEIWHLVHLARGRAQKRNDQLFSEPQHRDWQR